MDHEIRLIPEKGQVLWLTDGKTEVGLALDYGIRIVHLSCTGCENLLYEQPVDLSDGLTTERGWRIFGGHRLWTAPESELSYFPDHIPVSYALSDNGAVLTQTVDPWLNVRKQLQIEFEEDGTLLLHHRVVNISDSTKTYASWGVTTFAGGSKAEIWFDGSVESYNPQKKVALWGMTNLSDSRLRFTPDRIFAEHLHGGSELKIGTFSFRGHAELTNNGQRFSMDFEADPYGTYPDEGSNFELYMDAHVIELEAVGQLRTLAPGEAAEHWERWQVETILGGRP